MSEAPNPQVEAAPEPQHRRWITPKLIIIAGLSVLAIWFIIANRQSAHIHLWVASVGAPLWLVLLLIFLGGMATGWLLRGRRT